MQSKNQNDSVQLSTRYQQYDFAKRCAGGFGGRQVFPIGGTDGENQRTLCPTIRATHYKSGDNQPLIRTNQSGLQQIRELPDNTDSRGGQTHPADFRIRRLTPKECERLMGLPDGWTEGVSDTQRYKLCGNGVVVNVVREIIKRLF